MNNPEVTNPNDFKVVEFRNPHDFAFTPEMGSMYDGRPISGISGNPGIAAGESITLPYHIGHRLAENLAKYALLHSAGSKEPVLDAHGQPIVAPLWDTVKLENMKNSYLTELYREERPVAQSETDRLMAKVEEYKAMVDKLVGADAPKAPETPDPKSFQDKAEVIAELEKRGIAHDKRSNKATLEALLPAD